MVGRKIFLYALVAMLIATVFSGYVRAVDIADDFDNLTDLVVNVVNPHVDGVDIIDWDETAATGALAIAASVSKADQQIDVSTATGAGAEECYAIKADVRMEATGGGIDSIDRVTLYAYHDLGAAIVDPAVGFAAAAAVGDNLALEIQIDITDWTLGTGVYTMNDGGGANEHTDMTAYASPDFYIVENTATTGTVYAAFEPNQQVRNSSSGVTTAGIGLANFDTWTWDFYAVATDTVGAVSSDSTEASAAWEFGYFKYVEIAALAGNSIGSGRPGQTIYIDAPGGGVEYRANVDHNVSVNLAGNLLGGGAPIIGAENVSLRDWDAGPAVYVPFVNGGSRVDIYAAPMSALNLGTSTNGTAADESLDIQWEVAIPLGTPEDTYSTDVIYWIDAA
jgi:hypothetical protein